MTAPLAGKPVALWDPVVRVTHWAVALSVIANALLTEGGGTLHVWIGWIAMALLLLRLVWGLTGPREARFSSFPLRPLAALAHVGDLLRGRAREYPTHNPAGALMAYALWACLAVVIATGLVMTGGATPMKVQADREAVAAGDWQALVAGDESGEDDDDAGEAVEEVHEVAANLMLVLAALHVAGVVVESRALGRNLALPMLAGARRRRRDGDRRS